MIGGNKFNWIQFYAFFPNRLSKFNDYTENIILIDIALGFMIKVVFINKDFIKNFHDNSSLFRCKILGPPRLETFYTGTGYFNDSFVPFIKLYHHTKYEYKVMIEKSKTLKPSKWNFQGTKELKNINFVYFTSLDEIKKDNDLIQIAMSNNGKIYLFKDNFELPKLITQDFLKKNKEDICEIIVYRESTANRNENIELFIDTTNLFSPNLLFHRPSGIIPFYEVCNSYIYRVGVDINSSLKYDNAVYSSRKTPIQDYIVAGDCTTIDGLMAPYDEEDTSEIFKIEPLSDKTNILDFWCNNANQELYSKKIIHKYEFCNNNS